MRLNNFRTSHRQGGFSLVELMVAMAAGLIIIGAAVMFTVSTMRSYSENILSARLTQELRAGMNLVVRELRRAGHDSTSVSRVLTTSSASGFTALTVEEDDEGCVAYTYDRQGDTEVRGFRLNPATGTLQLAAADDVTNPCTGDVDWEDLTDPDVVQITTFRPEVATNTFCARVGERDTSSPADGVSDEFDYAFGSVRTVSLCMRGRMVSRDDIVRHVTDSVRIRAEDLEFQTIAAPVPANICDLDIEAPTAPDTLNDECAE